MSDRKLNVRDLKIYQISYKLMLEIHRATLTFPKIEQFGGIADQLRRSSKSITSNIVEGFGKQKFYKDEFKRMLVYAIGSCDETLLWIDTSFDLGYICEKEFIYFKNNYTALVKQISAFTSKI